MAVTYEPVLADIGAKIIKRREELGMTAAELAIQADLSASSLSLYESGQRAMGVDKLNRIAAALRVPFSYLQPSELDRYSEMPDDFYPLMEQLKALPAEKRRMMLNMFSAQISTL